MKMKFEVYSEIQESNQVGKPNEDYIISDTNNNIYIVCDGVTMNKINDIYPNPSPVATITSYFANYIHDQIIKELDDFNKKKLISIVEDANEKLSKLNDKDKWDFLPGVVGIIAV